MWIVIILLALLALTFLILRREVYIKASRLSAEISSLSVVAELERVYRNCIITVSENQSFKDLYRLNFEQVERIIAKLRAFHVTVPENLSSFYHEYRSLDTIVSQHNSQVEGLILRHNALFFDSCLKYPLDLQQREAIIAEEDNVLVVSSAGSGKTSSIVGKVKYLIEKKHVKPENILLISYTNKAAAELTERVGVAGLNGFTFHKLALKIIGEATGVKPSICDNTDSIFVGIFHQLIKNEAFLKSMFSYFADYDLDVEEWEKRKAERQQELAEYKNNTIKSVFPDMDGNPIYVRSEQERKICFALTALGVNFRYEEPYEYPLADETHSQYRPDFSIHYEQDGKPYRIYLEHFAVNEHGLVPIWFAKDRGISYEEANKQYGDGITWKKEAHKKFGTKMICTTSADFNYSEIKDKVKLLLGEAGVPIHEKPIEELYGQVLPVNSKQEKTFIRLVVTFITLLKSRCTSFNDVEKKVIKAGDNRSLFVIQNIFRPVYVRYEAELQKRGQIDFTDAILQATQLCKKLHPVGYDYIIVDEFQDISMDRYCFLQALRAGARQAKLFCVGDDWQSIYRFSGSDMALFSQFKDYFGHTDVRRIETTYRFGEPLVSLSSSFIQRNKSQLKKHIHPFNRNQKTELLFQPYERSQYVDTLEWLIRSIPKGKSIFFLGRYSFDDYYLSFRYKTIKDNGNFYYEIEGRKIEFLTVHKSKGLEADYVILLQCNKGTFGFPSQISDDPVLQYVLSGSDQYPCGEERRLFYVAITRAKEKTFVLYDQRYPSVFVDEFLHPEKLTNESYTKHPNANKRWTRSADNYLLDLHRQGKSIKYIANKMGRSYTSIIMRLGKLEGGN